MSDTTYTLQIGEHTIKFRKPTRAEWKGYKRNLVKGVTQEKGSRSPVDLQEELIRQMIVSPDQDKLDEIAEQYGDVFDLVMEDIEALQSAGELKRSSKSV